MMRTDDDRVVLQLVARALHRWDYARHGRQGVVIHGIREE